MCFEQLRDLFDEYPVIVGGAHPFREGGHIPELPGIGQELSPWAIEHALAKDTIKGE